MDRSAPIMLGQTQKYNTPLERANQNYYVDQFAKSETKVSWSTINLEIVVFIRFCMANDWTGKACPFAIQNLVKIEMSKWWCFTILWCMTLTTGPLTNFGWLFPMVWCVFVFDQTLVEHLCIMYSIPWQRSIVNSAWVVTSRWLWIFHPTTAN